VDQERSRRLAASTLVSRIHDPDPAREALALSVAAEIDV
jgi:hypothetical protein